MHSVCVCVFRVGVSGGFPSHKCSLVASQSHQLFMGSPIGLDSHDKHDNQQAQSIRQIMKLPGYDDEVLGSHNKSETERNRDSATENRR